MTSANLPRKNTPISLELLDKELHASRPRWQSENDCSMARAACTLGVFLPKCNALLAASTKHGAHIESLETFSHLLMLLCRSTLFVVPLEHSLCVVSMSNCCFFGVPGHEDQQLEHLEASRPGIQEVEVATLWSVLWVDTAPNQG